jgi:4-aminobutyrate aminotransferase-like enzyme
MKLERHIGHLYGGRELARAPLLLADAEGIYLRDVAGNTYIDCASGTFDQPLGHQHPALVAAIQRQAAALAYAGSPFLSESLVELASALVEISPPNLTRVHLRDLTGSTAVEGAIKIAQLATGRRDVITMFTSHHGQTAFTTNVSGNAFRRAGYPVHQAGTLQVPAPYCYRCFYGKTYPSCGLACVDRIRDFIEYGSSGSVACIVVEPVQGNGGNLVPPPDYFRGLRRFCDEHGVLLILDEVQTAMGRLGYMFAAEYFDVQPHIIVMAKGLGGPVPRGAILVEEGLEVMPRYQHSFTGGSSLISVATALATIEELRRPGFLEGVREVGAFLGAHLQTLGRDVPFVGDVRGLGMMWGLEIVAPDGSPDVKLCNAIVDRGREFGLVLRSSRYGHGNVVKVRPPLIITREQVVELLARLHRLLGSFA